MNRVFFWIASLSLAAQVSADPSSYFTIEVIDDQTGRGVPLVELETVNSLKYYTDSNGLIAFREEGLMNREVFFYVRSHGYSFSKDGFGFPGRKLKVTPGGHEQLKITRTNIAQRLYRITGEGIYDDTLKLGRKAPIDSPFPNGGVVGQDSAMTAIYKGKAYWFWGDTLRAEYPLGNFRMSGAVADLPGQGGLDPAVGLKLKYFTDDKGFSRPMAEIPGEGIVWLDGIITVPDAQNNERMIARYLRLKGLGQVLEQGIAAWNDQTQRFEKVIQSLSLDDWRTPRGQPFIVERDGVKWIYASTPVANIRVKATFEDATNPDRYESFTCLKTGAKYEKPAELQRDDSSKLVWSWKPSTSSVGPKEERELIEAGGMKEAESRYLPLDIDGKKRINLHNGSIRWNDYRKKWIMIITEIYGTSMLGEIWYLEADSPEGPWPAAKKIVSHNQYSFYNPVHHPFLDQNAGQHIYFEGTYTAEFSGSPTKTPRYDYNQIMYRLDLSDPRLQLKK